MSYLTNQHQLVKIDQTSPKSPDQFGLPQGSILGPILFNIYVAQLPSCIDSDSIQYAEDNYLQNMLTQRHPTRNTQIRE